ncbi:MAG: hypothetical protein ACO2ZM_07495 [Francisellaceae bacterium]
MLASIMLLSVQSYAIDSSAGQTAASLYGSTSGVDERTGELGYSQVVGSLSNHHFEDDYALSLLYTSSVLADDAPYRVGKHWQYDLPYFMDNTFYDSDGSAYYVSSSQKDATTGMYLLNFAFTSIHDRKILGSLASDPSVVYAIYNDGRTERFQAQSGNAKYLLLSQISYASGLVLNFQYDSSGQLQTITNNYGDSIVVAVSGSGYSITSSSGNINALSLSDDELTSIVSQDSSGDAEKVNLYSYYSSGNPAGELADDLLKEVDLFDPHQGSVISSTLYSYGDIVASTGSTTFDLPVVTSVCAYQDATKSKYTQTFYTYGETESSSYYLSNTCPNAVNDDMKSFTGNNYTGYPLTQITTSASDSSNIFAETNHTGFSYNVSTALYSSDDITSPISTKTDYYDHLQRKLNSVITKGDQTNEIAYGYDDSLTPSYTVATNNTMNQLSTSFTDNVTPASVSYAEAKVKYDRVTVNGRQFEQKAEVSYDDYGNVVESIDDNDDITKKFSYARDSDGSCQYPDVSNAGLSY